jgi:outer membrane lipoprotein-sorting protein
MMGFFHQICLLDSGKVAPMSNTRLVDFLLPSAMLIAAIFLPAAKAAAAAQAAFADEEARATLRQAVVFHRQARDIAFRFEAEIYNADLDKRDKYRGRLLLKDSSRFRLEIPGGTYVSDGKSFWEYHAKNNQAVVRAAADMAGQPLPGEVLLRFLDSEPLSVARVKAGGKEVLELRLDPARAMKNLDSLSVQLDRKDHSLRRIASRDVTGNESVYTLLSVKRNAGIKDKEFAFVAPKGVEVVDMR